MRLTRTEVNMAYRAADCDRWSKIPFVVGIEVKRSNHPFGCELCEALKGKYPKDFVFTGWHPQCRCYIVPVMASEEERMAYHRAVLNGEDVSDWKFGGEITEPHSGFQKWMGENRERIEGARSLPYWMKDNGKYVGGNPKGIKGEMVNSQKQVPVGSAAMPSGLGSYEQKLWNDNEIEVSEKLEITQGWPMTHEQADDRHANPNYVAGERNGYDINCQSCVVAYEMRRRGFDVEALRRIENDPNNGPQRLAIDTCSAWIDPKTGKQPSKTNCRGTYFDKKDGKLKVFSIDDVIEKLNAETKEIGRYHLDWTWNFQQNGHTIVAERFKNGGLRLFDPQTGEITSWDNFKNRIYIRNGVNVLKVDELMPNPSVVATVVRTKI